MVKTIIMERTLNSATRATLLADRIISELEKNNTITLDFIDTDRMIPSFSNAFFMTILHRYSSDIFRDRIRIVNQNLEVSEYMNQTISRYQKGIRLSTQR
jgi:hypothetical protein